MTDSATDEVETDDLDIEPPWDADIEVHEDE